MTNPHGSFIWYELLTSDADAAASFYQSVIGWNAESAAMEGMDYRFFRTPEGGGVGGFMAISPEMAAGGARPGWLGYIGVDDVDASVARLLEQGGAVHMPAMDLAGVGRMAMVADPQGAPFYVMRGASDEVSHSFDPQARGHCHWNELSTTDPTAATAFYSDLCGWTKGGVMPMGEMGDYQFLDHAGQTFGAVMRQPMPGGPSLWLYYFGVADIDAAHAAIGGAGGQVMHGPAEIPGGEFIVVAADPQGAMFGIVGPRTAVQG
jgi:predicted enzyme related to lactoylglutathione lyase